MSQVKICGINDRLALTAATEAAADWIGFVFFPPPRFVQPERAADLLHQAGSLPLRVGLFVEPDEADIGKVLGAVRLDVLQIYGAQDRLETIRRAFGLPIWHAVGVSGAADLPVHRRGAERLVLEAKPPPGANRPGGNAATFDWRILQGWRAPGPWMLAGGLTPSNVTEAIGLTGAQAVDVSSGVESARGVKDPDLIRAFVAAAKRAGA